MSLFLNTVIYYGDRPLDFAGIKALYIYLDQISTTGNRLNGMHSKLLCLVPVVSNGTDSVPSRFGDIVAVRFEHPELKRFQTGMINELKFIVRNDRGRVLIRQ